MELLNACGLCSISVIKEEQSDAKEYVDDRRYEGKMQDQACKVFDAWSFHADQVGQEEADLEEEREKHDEQVLNGKEFMVVFKEV